MTELLYRAEDAVSEPTDQRRIDIRIMRWGEVATNTLEGVKETFARGAFSGTDPGRVILESQRHDGAIVGVGESIQETDEGAFMTFRVASTPSGDELLTLAREGIMKDASVVFASRKSRPRPGGVVERQAVDLARVAILPRGAYPSSQVLAVREAAPQEDPMNEAAVDLSPVTNAIEAVETRMAALEALQSAPAGQNDSGLFRFRTLGEYARAAYAGPSAYMSRPGSGDELLARTIADQITTHNEGLIVPGYIKDVKRIVDLGRRAINAFGGARPLPEKGMSVQWPFLASSNTVIGTQSTQKTEVTSARVDIDDASSSIVTYAGGSDISYQLLERSDPSYYDAYQRIMLGEWAKVTDAAFAAALEGASGTTTKVGSGMLGPALALTTSAHSDDIFDTTPDHGFAAGDRVVFSSLTGGDATTAALVGRVVHVIPTSLGAKTFRISLTPGGAPFAYGTADITAGNVHKFTDTGNVLRANLFEASVAIEDATGQPANIALASTDMFLAIAAMSGIVPPIPAGNPSNASGTALASSLRLDVSGLEIIRVPGISVGKIVLSNREAAAWLEDGPKWVTAEDVHLLGRDVAVYSFAAPAVFVPAAIVELTLV